MHPHLARGALRKTGQPSEHLGKEPGHANALLVKYILWQFDAGAAHWRGQHAALCMQTTFRSLRGELREA